jgi:Cof subfamily protein (haloacid dehalogenase superfamily)
VIGLLEALRPGGRFDEWRDTPVKGVFLDVDGTTLGAEHEPSAAVAGACRALRDAGLQLGFATGRPPAGLASLIRAADPDGPHVVYNGAQVLLPGTDRQEWTLPVDAADTLRHWCAHHGVYAEFAVGADYLVTDFREEMRPTWREINGEPRGSVDDVDFEIVRPCKVTVNSFDPALLVGLLAVCRTLDVHVDLSSAPILPGATVVNVTAAGVTKGAGVRWAARRLGLPTENLLVVGDGENDVSMFHVAGTAIAMGQAPDYVKEFAHFVTDDFDDDGCVTAVEALLDRS